MIAEIDLKLLNKLFDEALDSTEDKGIKEAYIRSKKMVNDSIERAKILKKRGCSTCSHLVHSACDYGYGYICEGEDWEPIVTTNKNK